jgi:hypothetical protein
MSKARPNIPPVPFNDRDRFKNLVLEVIDDMSIYEHIPDSISLDGVLFTLTLSNKKFVYQDIQVDVDSDYVDVYLQGIKKVADLYSVREVGNDIIIEFNQTITLVPEEIVNTDFIVKGKIVERT